MTKCKKNRSLRNPFQIFSVCSVGTPTPPARVRSPALACSGVVWLYYSWDNTALSVRDVKQGCSVRTYAFKIMHRPKRTWMTQRKSKGPETDRYPAWMWLLQTGACRSRNCRAHVAPYGCSTQYSHSKKKEDPKSFQPRYETNKQTHVSLWSDD